MPQMDAEVEKHVQIVWNFMKVGHVLKKPVDCIFALGSFDTSIAERAADLYLQGYDTVLAISGSGTVHGTAGVNAWDKFAGRPEAAVFADIAMARGVPKEAIITEVSLVVLVLRV